MSFQQSTNNNKTQSIILKTKHDKDFLLYKSDTYKVYNIIERDIFCDLHIIAYTKEGDKLLIPVDKRMVMKYLPYFENMFREESNWIEGKKLKTEADSQTNDEEDQVTKTFIFVKNPTVFAEYLKSLYTDTLEITVENCIDLYEIVDFMLDTTHLADIEKFIEENLCLSNAIKLMNYSDKFDQRISDFFKKYEIKKVSEEQSDSLNKIKMEVFIRFMNCLGCHFSSTIFIDAILKRIEILETTEFTIDDSIDRLVKEIKFENLSSGHRIKLFNKLFQKCSRIESKDGLQKYLLSEWGSDDNENLDPRNECSFSQSKNKIAYENDSPIMADKDMIDKTKGTNGISFEAKYFENEHKETPYPRNRAFNMHNIIVMHPINSTKNLQELRLEDYMNGQKEGSCSHYPGYMRDYNKLRNMRTWKATLE